MGFTSPCPAVRRKSLKNKYSSFFSNRRDIPEPEPEPESSVKRIYPLLRESFEDSLKEEQEN